MMTPVYNIAAADLRANRCSATRHAAKWSLFAFSTTRTLRKHKPSPTKKHLLPCCLRNVRKHIFQCFHFNCNETNKYFYRTQKPRKNNSLSTTKSPIQDVLANYLNHNPYRSEANSLTYYNVVKSGTDALWQQTRFELKVRKSESNVLRGYIKEQPADDTTITTDEEK